MECHYFREGTNFRGQQRFQQELNNFRGQQKISARIEQLPAIIATMLLLYDSRDGHLRSPPSPPSCHFAFVLY